MSVHGCRSAGAGLSDARLGERRRLRIVFALTVTYMIAEVIGGWWTGSLALLADAGHMLTDAAALIVALAAFRVAELPATGRHTYAFARAEILGGLLNGVVLAVIVVWLGVEAVQRLWNPPDVRSGAMIVVAAGGLVVNGIALRVLHSGGDHPHSVNTRGAALHVLGDLLGSVGALSAGVVIALTGWTRADPVASLLIAVLVLGASWRIVRDTIHVLLEGAPAGIDVAEIQESLRDHAGVIGVHDLHVWTIASDFPALSVHVVCEQRTDMEALLWGIRRMLNERFGIEHTTVQVEIGDLTSADRGRA